MLATDEDHELEVGSRSISLKCLLLAAKAVALTQRDHKTDKRNRYLISEGLCIILSSLLNKLWMFYRCQNFEILNDGMPQ